MQAILTKYLGPTDHRGARIIARCDAGKKTVSWNHGSGVPENHAAAAWELAESLGWVGDAFGSLISGCLHTGDYAHVFASSKK